MSLMGLTDTHLHLHFPQYDADRDEVVRRAIHAGFRFLVNIGTDLEDSRKAIAVAEKYPEVYAAVGYHPNETQTASDADLAEVERLLAHPKVVAVGEVGLDYFHDHSPRDVQEKLLRVFLGWYVKHNKPVIIHCRDAYDDLRRVLLEEVRSPFRGVLHCFSSTAEVMKQYLDLGFYIAFGGALTYKKNDALRDACRVCPKDRLVLETDAPYLAPQSRRGQRNEPIYMSETAECAAGLHGMSAGAMAELTTTNAGRLFGL
ncbi:MAG TPA: TatD family hydrolase [Candidatus Omnitrophota bacterium]|nr:TatD family hydrolase [Candidatus Omnitrophota bacterium]HPS37534.1 TatD family hydrolase [Candidatus Omnitrophota bacterium]